MNRKYGLLLCGFALALGVWAYFASVTAQDRPAAPAGWQPVYRHNEKGEPLGGSKQALINAIRQGYNIRVGWGFKHPRRTDIRLEHVAIPHFLSIVKETEVTAILHEHGLLDSYISDTPRFKQPVQLWRCVLSTRGTFNAVYYPEDGRGELVDFPQRHIMTWFAELPAGRRAAPAPLF